MFRKDKKMKEIWKDIPGYEGKYQASNLGRIRSVERKVRGICHFTNKEFERTIKSRILKPGRYCKSNHVSVILGKGTSGKPVHQLIMKTFVGEMPKGMEVLHINGNPLDNRLSNLRYGTRRENILDVYYQGRKWRKLTLEDVYYIRFCILCGISQRAIAREVKISDSVISSIKKGRSYSWLK